MNSRDLGSSAGREAVWGLLMMDGLSPEEAIDFDVAPTYALGITGRTSTTAVSHVRRHLRSIDREARAGVPV